MRKITRKISSFPAQNLLDHKWKQGQLIHLDIDVPGGLHSPGEAAGPAPEAEAEDVRGVEPDHGGRLHRQGDGGQRADRRGHGRDVQDDGTGRFLLQISVSFLPALNGLTQFENIVRSNKIILQMNKVMDPMKVAKTMNDFSMAK